MSPSPHPQPDRSPLRRAWTLAILVPATCLFAIALTAPGPSSGPGSPASLGAVHAAKVAGDGGASLQSNDMRISQVYGGGGNAGAPFQCDFIEIFNGGSTTISVNGWSVQYASATGTSWQVTAINGSIPAGKYYLIQEVCGANGAALPTPDATGTIAMAAASGKVALVNSTTALTGQGLGGSSVVDFVGYGTASSCEGSPPGSCTTAAPALGNTTAALRGNDGCVDTDHNANDFAAGSPNPRNSSSPFKDCAAPTPTPTETLTPSITPTPSSTPTPSHTPTPTVTGGPTSTETPTPTVTATPTVTSTPTPSPTPQVSTSLVINEIDYDQPGTDAAEFIEIKNISASAIGLQGWTVELINGNNGGATPYPPSPIALQNVNLAAGDYYVVCGTGSSVPNCDLFVSSFTIQNGPPDAVGLRNGGTLVDTVSYEGNTGVPYTEGSGAGLQDAENGTTSISRCADGIDTNQNNVDFWSEASPISPGEANPCVATPTPTPSNTHTPTATPTDSAPPTDTSTPSATPTPSATSTATLTPTATLTSTATLSPTATRTPISGAARGDCNRDAAITAADMSALVLEVFDGDGMVPGDAPGGTFAGDPIGCNPNGDGTINAGDLSCLTQVLFGNPGVCVIP